jgi:hypothetical protein
MSLWSRRKFFLTSLAGSAAAGVTNLFARATPAAAKANGASDAMPRAQGNRPLIISSANGVNALGRGMDILKKGGDTLDAVVAAVTIVEDDPNDDSVGYGGLPNEQGEVELDASVMHGPTHRPPHQKRLASSQNRDGAHQSRHDRRRRRAPLRRRRRFRGDESPHRTLPQNLARLESLHVLQLAPRHR